MFRTSWLKNPANPSILTNYTLTSFINRIIYMLKYAFFNLMAATAGEYTKPSLIST